jgi:hypothetical protein
MEVNAPGFSEHVESENDDALWLGQRSLRKHTEGGAVL